jgi:hypothetical protein
MQNAASTASAAEYPSTSITDIAMSSSPLFRAFRESTRNGDEIQKFDLLVLCFVSARH